MGLDWRLAVSPPTLAENQARVRSATGTDGAVFMFFGFVFFLDACIISINIYRLLWTFKTKNQQIWIFL